MGKKEKQPFNTISDSEYWAWVDKAEYLIRHNYVDQNQDPIDLARRMYNKRNEI